MPDTVNGACLTPLMEHAWIRVLGHAWIRVLGHAWIRVLALGLIGWALAIPHRWVVPLPSHYPGYTPPTTLLLHGARHARWDTVLNA